MAEAVAKGAGSVADVKVQTIAINGKDIVEGRYKNAAVLEQLDASDAIIFGSPTYMGGPSGQFNCFADATGERWYIGKWKNKVAAGFTVSSGPSGDKLNTLHYFFTLAMPNSIELNLVRAFAGSTAMMPTAPFAVSSSSSVSFASPSNEFRSSSFGAALLCSPGGGLTIRRCLPQQLTASTHPLVHTDPISSRSSSSASSPRRSPASSCSPPLDAPPCCTRSTPP